MRNGDIHVFDKLLVANRGEIARRVLRTANRLGIPTVAVYSEVDAQARHVGDADESVLIGPAAPGESYLSPKRLLDAAIRTGADAVHPGYGFLAENPDFAKQVEASGLTWVGPSAETIALAGDKIGARDLAEKTGVPVLRASHGPLDDETEALAIAGDIGYPVMLKAAAGGGGIGMRLARDPEDLRSAFASAQSQAERFFANGRVLVEQCLPDARHVEIQVLTTADGQVVTLGERECSVQRRYQKVVEETPSPAVTADLRDRMSAAARAFVSQIGATNAGTFECLVSGDGFWFLEYNARIQVEHPITELVTGLDLVEEQLRSAAGEGAGFVPDSVRLHGHAFEFRIYAEDPVRFLPSPGEIATWFEPEAEWIRIDAGYGAGDTVSPHYDPLLAKLCVWGNDRNEALRRAREAVRIFEIDGIKTNLPFHARLLENEQFSNGEYNTRFVDTLVRAQGPDT